MLGGCRMRRWPPGSTLLPGGYWHPHASEQARTIAEAGMILRVQVGSGLHGTGVAGQDDRDEMGLCVEPPQFVTGLARVPSGVGGSGRRFGSSSTSGTLRGTGQAGWLIDQVPVIWMWSSIRRVSGRGWR